MKSHKPFTRSLIAAGLLVAAAICFFAAGATSQRPNGANTGPGAGALSNILFGGCLASVLALIVFGVATLIQSRRSGHSSGDQL